MMRRLRSVCYLLDTNNMLFFVYFSCILLKKPIELLVTKQLKYT